MVTGFVFLTVVIILVQCKDSNEEHTNIPVIKEKTEAKDQTGKPLHIDIADQTTEPQTAVVTPEKEIITVNFPKTENPTAPIPEQPLTDKAIKEFVEFLSDFNKKGDMWYSFGGSLEKFPPDLDGSPKSEQNCLKDEIYGNTCTAYTVSEWQIGKIFAQFIIYNYEFGDKKVAGQVAWVLDENIPWAKYIVSAWADYFIPKYKNFKNFDQQMKIMTGWTDTVTIDEDGNKKYEYERKYNEVVIPSRRNKNGLLVRLYTCVADPIKEGREKCPWMEFADETVEKNFDGLDRAIFYLGPQGTKKAIRLLEDVNDILTNHPEKKIAIK